MCFSAEVSFAASAVIAVTALPGLRRAKFSGEWLLALMPVLFSAQQFIEGLIWLKVGQGQDTYLLSTAYLVFANALWPLLCCLTALQMEEQNGKRRLLMAAMPFCILMSGYLGYITFAYEYRADSCYSCGGVLLYYADIRVASWMGYAYFALTCLPLIISSVRTVRLFGLLITAGFALTLYSHEMRIVASVWCFFAACCSCVVALYFIKKGPKRKKKKAVSK